MFDETVDEPQGSETNSQVIKKSEMVQNEQCGEFSEAESQASNLSMASDREVEKSQGQVWKSDMSTWT